MSLEQGTRVAFQKDEQGPRAALQRDEQGFARPSPRALVSSSFEQASSSTPVRDQPSILQSRFAPNNDF